MAQAEGILGQSQGVLATGPAPQKAKSVRPERFWTPLWLHDGPVAPEDVLQVQWEKLAREDSQASVHFLPQVGLGAYQNENRPLVYAHWAQAAGVPKLTSLAILPNRDLQVSILPKVRPVVLRGRRVVESQLIGDSSPAAIEAFVSSISRHLEQGDLDCITFPDLDVESPLRKALAEASKKHRVMARYPSKPEPHWWIRFPETKPDTYWNQFSKKTRYNFRYRAKHLEHTVRCIRQPGEVREFLDAVVDLSQRTWQYKRLGTKIDVNRKLELWTAIAQSGAFRSYLLEHGGRPIAFASCFQWKDHFIYEETGYDPEFAAKSPGQVLLYRVIENLIAKGTPRTFDFGYGDNEYKRIFANHQTLSGPVVLIRRNLRPMLTMGIAEMRSDLSKGSRMLLNKLGIASMLRHIHRGHATPKPASAEEKGEGEGEADPKKQ